jgi:hypothetical protein
LRLTSAFILKMIITRVSIVRTIPSPIILWSDYINFKVKLRHYFATGYIR